MDNTKEEDGLEEVLDTIIITDSDGVDVEFTIIDAIKCDDITYLLVVATENLDDDESEADILKEVADEGNELVYEFIKDEEEFERVAAIFQENDDEYDIEI